MSYQKYIDWSKFTFRASGFGHAMVPPKGKSYLQKLQEAELKLSGVESEIESTKNKETKTYAKLLEKQKDLNTLLDRLEPLKDIPNLSEGCKTYLCDIYTAEKFGRVEDIKSKYMQKGLHMEEDAITLYSLYCKENFVKNKNRMDNGWVQGECDLDVKYLNYEMDVKDFIGDTKVNWTIFQFTRTVAKKVNPVYKWQIKIYCWLYGKKLGKIIYCLLDTPEHLIVSEEKKLLYDFLGTKEEYQEACLELRKNHTYGDVPIEEKVREYEVEYSDSDSLLIKKRVEECRWYLANVIDKHKVDEDEEVE